jgi:hypothetical protein
MGCPTFLGFFMAFMRPCNYSLRWFNILLCLLSSVTAVHGIKVQGLDITTITSQHNTQEATTATLTSSAVDSLDKLLEHYLFSEVPIDNEVLIAFPEEDRSTQSSSSELTDTDEEGKRENDREAGRGWVSFALNSVPNNPASNRAYLLRENEINITGDSFTEHLCRKLSKDAFHIANAQKYARSREVTTCLCVVLRDKNGRAKKFVFHNDKDKMSTTMEQKAQELYYAIRNGYQAHAEAEFIEFLLHRSKQDPERYTHILGMGCSRQHCKECNCLLKLYLGNNYHKFTAAMHMTESPQLPIITDCQEDGLHMRIEANYKLTHREEAISNGSNSNKYYLPKALQENIKNKTGLYIDFSNDRFTIKDDDKAVERRDRKRKASISVPQTDPK